MLDSEAAKDDASASALEWFLHIVVAATAETATHAKEKKVLGVRKEC